MKKIPNLAECSIEELTHILRKSSSLDWNQAVFETKGKPGQSHWRANLAGANLEGASLTGMDLTDAYLRRADLRNADLDNSNCQGAFLDRADLRGANFDCAHLEKASLCFVNMKETKLTRATLTNTRMYKADLTNAECNEANLCRANLIEAKIWNTDLHKAHLREANLSDAQIENTELRSADMQRANLRRVSIYRCDLTEANLRDTILTDAEIEKSNLTNTNIENANIWNAKIAGSIFRFKRTKVVLSGECHNAGTVDRLMDYSSPILVFSTEGTPGHIVHAGSWMGTLDEFDTHLRSGWMDEADKERFSPHLNHLVGVIESAISTWPNIIIQKPEPPEISSSNLNSPVSYLEAEAQRTGKSSVDIALGDI